MDLQEEMQRLQQNSFPHTRGDGPTKAYLRGCSLQFSPHPWGWTDRRDVRPSVDGVFPTPVGMDRHHRGIQKDRGRFPHTRGDGPIHQQLFSGGSMFSPHPWGWTEALGPVGVHFVVFPTPVGMDLTGHFSDRNNIRFPHTRGDGPTASNSRPPRVWFSPHPWGWTVKIRLCRRGQHVFPTPVGMDLVTPTERIYTIVFPTPVGMDR